MTARKLQTPCVLGAESWILASLFASYDGSPHPVLGLECRIASGYGAPITQLAERLPPSLRTLIEDFSPSQVAGRITIPVLATHSTDDPLVPYAELSRFPARMPHAKTSTVQLLRHVDFDPTSPSGWWPLLPDLWNMWHFTTWILAG